MLVTTQFTPKAGLRVAVGWWVWKGKECLDLDTVLTEVTALR
jgi:hypothetical protein